MMLNWLQAVEKILDSNSSDLKELAALAGLDPRTFYVGQDLSGCDLSGQDLTGLDLTGTNLTAANLDSDTLIDPFFDPRMDLGTKSRHLEIPIELLGLVGIHQESRGYYHLGNAIKDLLDISYVEISTREETYWRNIISGNRTFFNHMFSTPQNHRKRFVLKIKDVVYHLFYRMGLGQTGRSAGIILALIVGLKATGIIRFSPGAVEGESIRSRYQRDSGWETWIETLRWAEKEQVDDLFSVVGPNS